ncbi:MAG: efflux RND transporter periplasmic adaptor subunit [Bacteroidetes bacterium]|nr:efflux RND transporter periplasmic adaptor subunit [Bacteroidota bacterium]
MKKKYWILIIIVIVLAAIGAWLLFGKKGTAAVQWRTTKAEMGDLRVVVTATGTLQADTTVQVGTQVSGIIDKILVDFNSIVRKGQVVALLDTTYLAAAVEDASSSMYRAQVQVDLTKRNYDRNKQLFEEKVIAQADYDQSLSDYETAKGSARSAKSSLDRAKINLKYATIVAPVSGVVISRNVDRGQTVAASFSTPTLFSIANDLTKMQVQASIDEADIGKIQVGQDVAFTVDAYPEMTFAGTVRQIRLQPVVLQNVVNYTVIIDVPNPDLKLMPGMTANITVKIQEALGVMKIPSSALKFWPPDDVLAQALKEMPDSTKKVIERMLQFRQRMNAQGGTGTRPTGGTGGGSGQGGFGGSQGGFTGGQADRRMSGQGSEGKHSGRGRMGMIWVKTIANKLVPFRVKTGLTDGSYTAVEGGLKAGDEVVTGIINNQAATTTTQTPQNPFQPQMPRGGARGGR